MDVTFSRRPPLHRLSHAAGRRDVPWPAVSFITPAGRRAARPTDPRTDAGRVPAAGLRDGDVVPPAAKLVKWHVDRVLDHAAVMLIEAYVIRTPHPIEAALGTYLELDPGAVAFAPGFGASDIPGNTPLMSMRLGRHPTEAEHSFSLDRLARTVSAADQRLKLCR
jgi:hypothetical protein